MPTYTVEAVEKIRDYQKDTTKPPVPIYKLTLNNGEQSKDAELFDNLRLNPTPGMQVTGDVEDGQYGPKFKPARAPGGRPGRSPEENARIMRQHSQEMALRYCAAKGKADFSLDDLKSLIEWFDADAKAATP